jgi:hypothetical protein
MEHIDIFEEEEDETLNHISCNMFHDIDTRMDAIKKLSYSETMETINTLCAMYILSNLNSIRTYLIKICVETNIETLSKLKSISLIIDSYELNEDKIKENFNTLSLILQVNKDIPITSIINYAHVLMRSPDHIEETLKILIDIIETDTLDNEFRYATILSLENVEQSSSPVDFYISKLCSNFLQNKDNSLSFRMLSAQYILQKCKEYDSELGEVIMEINTCEMKITLVDLGRDNITQEFVVDMTQENMNLFNVSCLHFNYIESRDSILPYEKTHENLEICKFITNIRKETQINTIHNLSTIVIVMHKY